MYNIWIYTIRDVYILFSESTNKLNLNYVWYFVFVFVFGQWRFESCLNIIETCLFVFSDVNAIEMIIYIIDLHWMVYIEYCTMYSYWSWQIWTKKKRHLILNWSYSTSWAKSLILRFYGVCVYLWVIITRFQ